MLASSFGPLLKEYRIEREADAVDGNLFVDLDVDAAAQNVAGEGDLIVEGDGGDLATPGIEETHMIVVV